MNLNWVKRYRGCYLLFDGHEDTHCWVGYDGISHEWWARREVGGHIQESFRKLSDAKLRLENAVKETR